MMNWRNVESMDYTELCQERYVVDMAHWNAYQEWDMERANAMYERLKEICAEIDKREAAVREEEAAEEREAINDLMASVFDENDD